MNPRRLPRVAFGSLSLGIWAGLGGVLGAALLARAYLGIPLRHFLGDPAAVTGSPFYLGLVSNVGALLWAASASIFLFAYHVHARSGGDREWARFLLWSGFFVAILGLDDFFMLHDQVFPNYLSISQSFVVGSYGVLAAAYLVRFAPIVRQTEYAVLMAALSMLAASAALDQVKDLFSISFAGSGFLEDGVKLLGIGTWLSYAIQTSRSVLAGERRLVYGARSSVRVRNRRVPIVP